MNTKEIRIGVMGTLRGGSYIENFGYERVLPLSARATQNLWMAYRNLLQKMLKCLTTLMNSLIAGCLML